VQTTKKQIKRTNIQKLIAERMLDSKLNKPSIYLEACADVTELMASRRRLKRQQGVRVTSNAFYILALARAAKQMPLTLAAMNGGSVRIPQTIDVGFAVNSAEGLMVPMIQNPQNITLAQIAEKEKSLTEKARSHHLTLDELRQPNIALSNLGAYGIDSFYAIIPPSASTILSMGNAAADAAVVNGDIQSRKFVALSLAADARIVPSPYAAKFLTTIKKLLENPAQLIDRA